MCSHQVPKISQQHHMLWPNLNFHIYINYKRGREGKGRGGPWGKGSTKVLLLGSAQCLGKICAGFQNCWSPFLAKANGRGRIFEDIYL